MQRRLCFVSSFPLNLKIVAKDITFEANQDLSINLNLKRHNISAHCISAFLLDSVQSAWRLTAVPRSVYFKLFKHEVCIVQ